MIKAFDNIKSAERYAAKLTTKFPGATYAVETYGNMSYVVVK